MKLRVAICAGGDLRPWGYMYTQNQEDICIHRTKKIHVYTGPRGYMYTRDQEEWIELIQ